MEGRREEGNEGNEVEGQCHDDDVVMKIPFIPPIIALSGVRVGATQKHFV
jgi:hypothetical protein